MASGRTWPARGRVPHHPRGGAGCRTNRLGDAHAGRVEDLHSCSRWVDASNQTRPGKTGGAAPRAQCPNPCPRGTGEGGPNDLRVSRHQGPVFHRVPDDPHRRDAKRFVADRGRQVGRFRLLASRRPDRGAEVGERIQASSMNRMHAAASRTQTSIEWRGSAGRVGSSNAADRPVIRASARRCSWISR